MTDLFSKLFELQTYLSLNLDILLTILVVTVLLILSGFFFWL